MNGNTWLKIVGFVLLVTMLGGLASMLLDPGMGDPADESRRAAHPAGFSVVVPRGWDVGMSQAADGRFAESMEFADASQIGIRSSVSITRLPPGQTSEADTRDGSVATTFQGQPARSINRELRNRWKWTTSFHRTQDDGHYEIVVTTPLKQDPQTSPLRGFLDTFRPASTPSPRTPATSQPATAPAAMP